MSLACGGRTELNFKRTMFNHEGKYLINDRTQRSAACVPPRFATRLARLTDAADTEDIAAALPSPGLTRGLDEGSRGHASRFKLPVGVRLPYLAAIHRDRAGTVLQCVYKWLIFQFCGRSGPTGTFVSSVPPWHTTPWKPRPSPVWPAGSSDEGYSGDELG